MTPAAPGSDRIGWQWSRFNELTADDLYAVVRLRESVFIVEQNCPYPDADGRDPNAWHLDMDGVKGSFGVDPTVESLTYRELTERRAVIRERMERHRRRRRR